MYYNKLARFVDSKGLSQKKFAEIMGVSANMAQRYLSGNAQFSAEFVYRLNQNFPEIDLNEIFAGESDNLNLVAESEESYNFNVIKEIEEIEKRLAKVKAEVKKKR